MSRTVVIHFEPLPGEESGLLINKLRNYGEDVFRFLRDTPWRTVDLGEVDRADTVLHHEREGIQNPTPNRMD